MQPQLDSSETLIGEHRRDAVDVARELRESWDNRLDFPPTKLPERYLRGDLAVRIEGSAKANNIALGKVCLSIEHGVDSSHSRSRHIEGSLRENEFTMLVRCIHLMNDPQRIVERASEQKSGIAVVGLHRLNDLSSRRPDALYFSLVSANCVFVRGFSRKDRERYSRRVFFPVSGAREFPSDMVQAGAQVVDDFAAEDAESAWDESVRVGFNRFLDGFRVIIGDNWVRPVMKECSDFSLQIQDVLVGPF